MEKIFSGKSIIICVPNHFELPFRIKENLEFLGFQVFQLSHKEGFTLEKKYLALHFLNKIFKKDKTLKARKKAEFSEKNQINALENISKADYALIIRPDLLSEKTIKKIKEKAGKTIAYQWDGIDRFPLVKEVMHYFDRFFVFDSRDIETYTHCLPTTNFYFDDVMEWTEINNDVFFVGTFMKNRINELSALSNFFKAQNLSTKIFVKKKKINKKEVEKNLIFIDKELSFKENLQLLKQSRIVLDFKNNIHYGLSFRTFESVGFEKKLITNNELVKNFDFYHPKNIFVLEDNYSEKELLKFIKQPYESLPKTIVEKYSFTNWIKYVLDYEPYQKIDLHYTSS